MKWFIVLATAIALILTLSSGALGNDGTPCPTGYVQDRVEGCQESGIWKRTTVSKSVTKGPKPDPAPKPATRVVKKPSTSWQWRYTVWMPAHWQRLASCESGSTPPNWQHHTGYEGAFGFAPSTWAGYKLKRWPAHAYEATPWQQWRVALRVARSTGGIRFPWGCWRGDDHAWVRGNVSLYAVQ